jgi:hypothetical protein
MLAGKARMIHNRYLPFWLHRVCNGVFGAAVLLGVGSIWFGEPVGSWQYVLSHCLIWSSVPVGIVLAFVARRFSIVEGVAGGEGYDDLREPPSESANQVAGDNRRGP